MNIFCCCIQSDKNDYKRIHNKKIKLQSINISTRQEYGNFLWEIQTNAEPNTLYLFPDNHFNHNTSIGGDAHTVIRKYNEHGFYFYKFKKPRSFGIIVATYYDAFHELTDQVKTIIDHNIKEIFILLKKYNYDKIKYHHHSNNSIFDSGTFKLKPHISSYIITRLKCLIKQINNI